MTYDIHRVVTEYEEARIKTAEDEATTSHGIRVNFLMAGKEGELGDIDYKELGLEDDEEDAKADKNDEENPWNKEAVAHNAAVLDEPPEVSMADHLKALTNVDKRGDNEGDDVFFYPIEHNLNDLF